MGSIDVIKMGDSGDKYLLCEEFPSPGLLCQCVKKHLCWFVSAAANSCFPCPKSVTRWGNEQ